MVHDMINKVVEINKLLREQISSETQEILNSKEYAKQERMAKSKLKQIKRFWLYYIFY